MKKILIITRGQFGTLTDTYQYCKHLSHTHKISYICFDENVPKMVLPNVNIHYISYKGNRLFRGIRFILLVMKHILFYNGAIFIVYFSQCEWIKRIMFWKKIHLDIRTLSVKQNEIERIKEDTAIANACQYFSTISVITEAIGHKLELSDKHPYILPLGADCISSVPCKTYSEMHLLYVGSLFNRKIIDTVIGVHKYINNNPESTISYDIVGDGEEIDTLKYYIKENHLESIIKIHGRVTYDNLKPFFDKCNIGISYVPIYDYYQHQPVTKTFEYIMSGLYCIATDTIENQKIVSPLNGILIESNSEAFTRALESISKKSDSIDFLAIKNTLLEYQWKNIIGDKLLPIINSLQK